jgi:Lrp/AsnC family leucine-responsive transcriptional regulator
LNNTYFYENNPIMDKIDRKILRYLQDNCRLSISDLGNLVGLSTSATHRRISILEKEGMIEKYTASLSGEKLGYSMIFFVEVSLENQSDKTLASFEKAALERPEVLECYLTTGSADYLVKVAAKDTKSYEQIYKRIIASLPHVSRIESSLVMKTVKAWSGYSLE